MSVAEAPGAASEPAVVDPRNPWLGLASYTEESRAFFFGREEEIADLARRVPRKLVTVLFGKSGLGKTSLVRAGLVPRLRGQGYCAVPVRIDYGRGAAEPAEQICQAIREGARSAGGSSLPGAAEEGESPWELLHRRGEVLRDASGAALIPLLIFDQFEEIFTLAQADEFGRSRAARVVRELADLVENRAPSALEARLEGDESLAERFDFARGDYRVLLVLREDYLASLESLAKAMPSILQNRVRLAPMTGTQALEAVLQPGKGLVSEEVGAAIVRFVAGGAELGTAEVEPSLLSLVCRELNDARRRFGRSEISLELLEGSHGTILGSFYERALTDQPAAVRRLIEDDLLTASGFRESVAEEGLLARLAAAGAAPDTLAVLINRRLLRIEERLDTRRVELTHDVLCPIVKSSRDQRHGREAREATERMLAEQRARELAARRSLRRARQVAAGCTVLTILALVAAAFAYINGQRAQRAERQAQEARALATQARTQAERLLAYLSDDFARELESVGRVDALAEFSQRQIDYFHALPAALRGPETIRAGALALVHHCRAMRVLGKVDASSADAAEAVRLLEGLREHGDHSQPTTVALALGYAAQALVLEVRFDPGDAVLSARAAGLLRPLAQAADAPVAVRQAYVEVLVRLGHEQLDAKRAEEAVSTEKEAIQLAGQTGAQDLSNLDMAAATAEAGAWLVEALIELGRNDEARRVGTQSIALADQVISRRPGHRLALHAEQLLCSNLADVALTELMPLEAVRFGLRSEQVSLALLKLDPNSVVTHLNLGNTHYVIAYALWQSGQMQASLPYFRRSLEDHNKAADGGPMFLLSSIFPVAELATKLADLGEAAAAQSTLASGQPWREKLRHSEALGSLGAVVADSIENLTAAELAFEGDDLDRAQRLAADGLRKLQGVTPNGDTERQFRDACLIFADELDGRTEYQLGHLAAAEKAWRGALAARQRVGAATDTGRRDRDQVTTVIALAVARQGRTAEAARTIAPVVGFLRQLAARNHGDRWLALELARALYVQALAEPARRVVLLSEAAALVEGLPAALRALHDVRQWRERIAEAQRGPATQADQSRMPGS
jgi:hypothetical protein